MTATAGAVDVVVLDSYVAPYRIPFLRALRAEVDSLVIVTCRVHEAVRTSLERDGIPMRMLPYAMIPRTWRHPAGFAQPEPIDVPHRLARTLRGLHVSAVISGDMGLRSVQAARYCHHNDVPLVLWARLSEHSEQQRGPARALVRPRLARQAARIVVNGASGRTYVESLGLPPDRIRVVPQALNPEAVAVRHGPARRPGDAVRLLSVGRVVQGKGLHHLLRAWSALPAAEASRWNLTVVGDGEARPRLELVAHTARLPVTFVGSQPATEVRRYLAATDFLVHPSLSDEWGLVVGEALASGVPVLGSVYAQAVNELVVDDVNGWRFRPDDMAEMTAALRRSSETTPPRWRTMSTKARHSAAHLQPAVIAAEFRSVLDEALGIVGQRRPARV